MSGASSSPGPSSHEVASRIGRAKGRFRNIRVDYDYQEDAVDGAYSFLLSQHDNPPGSAFDAASLIAPFGTGKTVAIEKLCALASADAEDGSIPVLHAEMPTSGNVDHIPDSILEALEERRPDVGRPAFRWEKAVRRLKEEGVRLLVWDEFDRAARRQTMSRPIANALQEHILDPGVAPILFVGTDEAGTLLRNCGALFDRLVDEIPLDPLTWTADDDKDVAERFLEAVDVQLVAETLFTRPSGLKGMAETLVAASDGRVRQIMKILRAGVGVAVEREADRLSTADLAFGWRQLPLKDRGRPNPFEGAAR